MPATTSATLLMIEDDAMVRRSIAAFLEGSGFAVLEAADGREGLEIFRREQPDLVLTDLRMPRLDGLAVIAALQEASPDTPIIVVSGAGKLEDAIEAVRRGAWDYVTRPIPDMAALELTVNRALERARLLRENRAHQEHLGQLVQERTAELRNTNEQLQLELTEHQRAEEALRAAEAKYRALVEQIAAVIYVDAIGDLSSTLYISPQVESMLGYSPEECTAQPKIWLTFIHPDDLQAWLTENKRTNETGERFRLDYRLMARDGRIVWVHDEASLTYDDSGQPLFWQGVLVDITERKQAEEALRESEERFRWLFTTSPDAILLIDPHASNVSWPIVDCNEVACQMNGYTREELIGQSVDILNTAPGTREERIAYLDRLRREGVIHVEAFHRHKDGHVFPIEVSTSLFTFEGRELVLGIDRDITERKRTEEALRASEERFRGALDNIPDVVVIYDRDLRIQYINTATRQITGRPASDYIGQRDADIWPPEICGTWLPTLRATFETRATRSVEIDLVLPDSGFRSLHITCVPLLDEAGEVREVLGITHDFTERKRAEEVIRESERRERERAAELQTIMDIVPTTIWIARDQMCQTITGNRAAYESRRLPPDSNISLTMPGNEGPTHYRIYRNGVELPPNDLPLQVTAATGVELRDFEQDVVFDDGTIIHELGNVVPLFDEQGRPRGAVAAFLDITERKQAEAELRQERDRTKEYLDIAGVMIIVIDANGRITLINPKGCTILGYSKEDLLGKDWFETCIPAWLRSQVKTVFEKLIRHEAEPIEYFENPVVTRGGEERIIAWHNAVLTDGKGHVIGTLSSGEDITERKRMEQALQDKVTALQTLAEVDREIIAATEPQGILDLVCRCAAELVHAPKSAAAIRVAPDRIEMAASYGLSDPARASQEFAQFWQAGMMLPVVHEARAAIAVNDVLAGSSPMPEFQASENIRALAIVRLAAGEEILGALTVFDTAPHTWSADEMGVLTMLAGQAAVALEKVRLFEAARDRALHLATLNEIGQAITSSLDLDNVLVTLLEKVRQAAEAEACSVALVDKVSGDLVFRQAVGGATHSVIGLRLQLGQGIAGWVALHGQSILVPDAASDARSYKLDDSSGFVTRDLVGVPLTVRNAVTGVIELVNKRSGRFSEEDVRLLESVAAQAAIVIENARLFETERAGRQWLETLYRIGQAVNSTLDADTILDRLTDEAMRATHATHGSALVARPDQSCFERRSLRGYSPEQTERARSHRLPLDRGVNGRAYRLRQTVYIDDVYNDPDYYSLVPDTRSELAVPIIRGGQVIGNLDLQSPKVDAFRDVSLDFLQALTNQVAIALENARLFEETRRQMDEMSIVSQVALVGAAGRPFDETVARATDALSRLWPDAFLGFLFVDEATQLFRPHPSYHGALPETLATLSIPMSKGIIGWAARERQPVRVGNVNADPRYIAKIPSMQSEMVAPLVAGDRVFGVVNVDSPRLDAFSGDDLRLLTTLAGQLATIFEKARLDAALEAERASLARRVEERTAELRTANEQLRQAHEEVSRALGKEKELSELKTRFISMASHEFRTPLTTILSSAELLEHYSRQWTEDKKLEHFRRIQTATKNMMGLLGDVLLVGKVEAGKLGFIPAPIDLDKFCRDIVEELRLSAGAKHSLVLTVQGDATQAHMDETLLRHILSNLLSNAIKYSPPGSIIQFELACREGQAVFQISDQGIGIPPEDQTHLFETFHRAANVRNIAGTGLGMAIVKRSIDLHGGTIDVASQIGVGTTVTVRLPLGAVSDE